MKKACIPLHSMFFIAEMQAIIFLFYGK